jgi:alginate O-acetyltransferase complex protein AlgI
MPLIVGRIRGAACRQQPAGNFLRYAGTVAVDAKRGKLLDRDRHAGRAAARSTGMGIMLFPTFAFLAFFAVFLPVYWAIRPHRGRMLWLLVASCVFYMSWNPWLILLILFSASVDYFAGLAIEKSQSARWRRTLLIGSITLNLSLLGFFKYANFFLDSTYRVLGLFEVSLSRPTLDIILPLGISFYTFETISYIVDVYRGRARAVRDPLDYAIFIMFFPHLVAGPIVRPRDFLPQLRRRKIFDWDRGHLGIRLFLLGFFKKSIVADYLGELVVDPVFADPVAFGSWSIWLGVLGYAIQIYGDFSGYSDMGIGLAHMLGFKLPMNFNYPYLAANVSDFWRRWHISLSSWLRDYLFIPLGGSKHGTLRTYANLMLVMLLGGLWHGANWTFVVWGLYHGLLLAGHRAMPWPRWLGRAALRPLCVVATFIAVCVGWVFFRAATLEQAGLMVMRMAWPTEGAALARSSAVLAVGCVALTLIGHLLGSRIDVIRAERRVPVPVMASALALLLALGLLLVPEGGRTFIYFQF